MTDPKRIAEEHLAITRRYFFALGTAGAAGLSVSNVWARKGERSALLAEAIAKLEYLTREENFATYGRGNPPPHKLPPDKRREVGLERDTWQLEMVADLESQAKLERPFSKEQGTALDWQALMNLAEKHAVRFLSVLTCTNGRKPLGMGLWEGVPLRELVWMVRPSPNVRRVFYYGYHNDDPKQRFQSSLPIGRVFEDPPGEHPVILCYKLNNRWLTIERGGPVRLLVPDLYANKSVKWLQRIVLTSNYQINDSYVQWNNDTESAIKTCARFIHTPKTIRAGDPAAITGVAQVGPSGLSKVQYGLHLQGDPLPSDDPYFAQADWKDAEVLPPPEQWGGGLPDGRLPAIPSQIDPATGQPRDWPLRNTIVHWAALLAGLKPGRYDLRCRTIDANGVAQPMPRPFLKSGHNAIEQVPLIVEA